MPIELKNYPSLIAIPYAETLKKDSIQRKDFQRVTLENILSFNAVVCLADYYEHNRPAEEDDDGAKQVKLSRVPNIDLGQISVGTWNMFAREFTRALNEHPKSTFLPSLVGLYHGNKAKDWEALAGSLISIRNKDAHGELIHAEKLSAELDKRQELIDKLMEAVGFYSDYTLIVPIASDVVGGKVQYTVKNFNGLLDTTITIGDSKSDLELFRIYLFNTKNGSSLDLSPMMIANPTAKDSKDFKLFLYSKTNNKKLGNIHYLSLDSSKDFESADKEANGEFLTPADICSEFQSFRIQVEDPSLHDQKKPALAISRTLKKDFISKNDLVEMILKIKNEGEVSADEVNISFSYPEDSFKLVNKDAEVIKLKNGFKEMFADEISLEPNQETSWTFFFEPLDAGQYEFPGLSVNYDYTDYKGEIVKHKVDKDGTITNQETQSPVYCTIYDPADPFSLAPVINLSLAVDYGKDENDKVKRSAYIGEIISLKIEIINSGLGVAKDVDFTIFPPKEMILKSGNPTWQGSINPLTTVTKNFEFELLDPGIHTISIRELVFANQDEQIFKTDGGSYNVLVRNNPKVQFQKMMEKLWEDLDISSDEADELKVFEKKFKNMLTPEEQTQIELDVKLRVIKKVISGFATNKGFKLLEKQMDGKVIYCYNHIKCPFMVVNYENPKDLKVFIKNDTQNNYPLELIQIKGFFRKENLCKIGFDLNQEFNLSTFKGGANALKGILGKYISWIDRNVYFKVLLKENLSEELAVPMDRIEIYPIRQYMEYWVFMNEGDSTRETQSVIKFMEGYFKQNNEFELVASMNDIDLSVRKKLNDLGYIYMKRNDEEDPIRCSPTDKSTVFLRIGNWRIKNAVEDRKAIAKAVTQFILKLHEIENENLGEILKKAELDDEVISQILDINGKVYQINSEMGASLGIMGIITKIETDKKGTSLTYFAVKDFPLYQDKQKLFALWAQKRKIEIAFRNIKDEMIEKYKEYISIEKKFFPYNINELSIESNDLLELFEYSLMNSSKELLTPGFYYLKAMLENEWVGSYDALLSGLVELSDNNIRLSFDNLQNWFTENEINGKVQKILSMSLIPSSVQKVEPILDVDRKDQLISISGEYLNLVKRVLNTYEVNIKPELLIFHKFKEIFYLELNKSKAGNLYNLNKKQANFFMLNHKEFYFNKGSHAFVNLKKDHLEIGVKITRDIALAQKIREKYNIMLSENNKTIQGCEVIEKTIKTTEQEDDNKFISLSILLEFNKVEEILSKEWIIRFVNIYNTFYQQVIPEEYFQIFVLEI